MLFQSALGAVFDQVFIPLTKNPLFVWLYVTVCAIAAVATLVFWLLFKHYNNEEDEMNRLDKTSTNRPTAGPKSNIV